MFGVRYAASSSNAILTYEQMDQLFSELPESLVHLIDEYYRPYFRARLSLDKFLKINGEMGVSRMKVTWHSCAKKLKWNACNQMININGSIDADEIMTSVTSVTSSSLVWRSVTTMQSKLHDKAWMCSQPDDSYITFTGTDDMQLKIQLHTPSIGACVDLN
jgi:hypothetical protein